MENDKVKEKISISLDDYHTLMCRDFKFLEALNIFKNEIRKILYEKIEYFSDRQIQQTIKSRNMTLLLFNLRMTYTSIKELYEKYLHLFDIEEIEEIIMRLAKEIALELHETQLHLKEE